ncbi:MAG: hypothetical protein KAR30_09670 [Gammaproteobacteria bacterium]|nr:hypothetical protein [Gammaproteobacteria bacterium]
MNAMDENNILNSFSDPNQVDSAELESQLIALEERLRELPDDASLGHASVQLDMARIHTGLDRGEQAWEMARKVFDVFMQAEAWEKATEACDVLFLSNQESSLSALGQGIWLSVTYPIDPELTLAMMQHVVDETPSDADGAAVAAAVGAYVVEMRAEGKQLEDLRFFANQLLGVVARRHSKIEKQEQFDLWFKRMELDDPAKFLVRMRNVVDVLVQEDWWFDREELQSRLPLN